MRRQSKFYWPRFGVPPAPPKEVGNVAVLVGDGLGNMIMTTPLLERLSSSGFKVYVFAAPYKQGTELALDNPDYVSGVYFVCEYRDINKPSEICLPAHLTFKCVVETFLIKAHQAFLSIPALSQVPVIKFPYSVYSDRDRPIAYMQSEYV